MLTKDAGECVICLEELLQGDTIARLPCLCIYHKRYEGAGRPSSATPRPQRAPSLWGEERASRHKDPEQGRGRGQQAGTSGRAGRRAGEACGSLAPWKVGSMCVSLSPPAPQCAETGLCLCAAESARREVLAAPPCSSAPGPTPSGPWRLLPGPAPRPQRPRGR